MQVKIRQISILLCGLLPFMQATAQKEYKSIRSYLKAKNGSEAMKLVEKLQTDSTFRLDPTLYDYGRQAQVLLNDALNEKAYLKQPYDTAQLFMTTLQLCRYTLLCDSTERLLVNAGAGKAKYLKQNRQVLRRYHRNLGAGGRYFYAKKQYREAAECMDNYLSIPKSEIWGKDSLPVEMREYTANAYVFQNSVFQLSDFTRVEKYKEYTMADTAIRRSVIELLARAAEGLQHTPQMLQYLEQGLRENPSDVYFFTRLTDHYNSVEEYAKSLQLADTLLAIYPDNLLYLASVSLSHLNMCHYKEAIQAAGHCLEIDSTLTEFHYYIGAAYCKLASEIVLPANINSKSYKSLSKQQKDYYREALPHLETYREAYPDDRKKWAPLLYRTYWALNMGKKFAEIEDVMNNLEK